MIFIKICFWTSIFALVHTYVFYPLILWISSRKKKSNQLVYKGVNEWPEVQVFMAVHNEEYVIREKMESLLALDYPKDKLSFFIGSDNSSDGTNAIIEGFSSKLPTLSFIPFFERQGKPNLINQLVEKASEENESSSVIYLLTDASVMLAPDCLKELVKHFKNDNIFLVDANMNSLGLDLGGISKSEGAYMKSEVRIKDMESRAWGTMIGPFGGCYALRGSYYHHVPENYLVDDFYITMKGYEKSGQAINELNANCYEMVGVSNKEEFKRKARISAGNFQNMRTFSKLWFPPFNKLAFAFFSHKILRWMGPFLIIFALLSLIAINLYAKTLLYEILLSGLVVWLFIVPVLDYIFSNCGWQLRLLRNITYFNSMNLALMAGFFKYINGIDNNVWQPPKRG